MRRLINGQEGWTRHIGPDHVVLFEFQPPVGTPKGKENARFHLKNRGESKQTEPAITVLDDLAEQIPKLAPLVEKYKESPAEAVYYAELEVRWLSSQRR